MLTTAPLLKEITLAIELKISNMNIPIKGEAFKLTVVTAYKTRF